MRKHVHHSRKTPVTEREMSSYTFRSSTPIDCSETDLTWRYRSHWDIDDDGCLSAQLDNILNPDLDNHSQDRNILLILEKLNRSEKDISYKGYALQHTLDEILYKLINEYITKNKKPEKAIKKFKKHFSSGSDIKTWFVDHQYTLIFDSESFDLSEYIGQENESNFWITIQKMIIKYFQIDIELEKSPILNWPSVWSQSFKQALTRKIKEISPDKIITLSPDNQIRHRKQGNMNMNNNNHNNNNHNNNNNNNQQPIIDRFDEANLHHSANKTAENWYKEFLCKKDYKMDSNNKQKAAFIKQTKRVCDGCGHSIKSNRSEVKSVIFYTGGWPQEQRFIFHDENCVKVRKYLEAIRQFVFDVDMYLNKNHRPLTNWRRLLHLIQNKDYVLSIKQKIPRPIKATQIGDIWDENEFAARSIHTINNNTNSSHNNNNKNGSKYATNYIPLTEIASFRRKRKLSQYHLQIELIQAIQHMMINDDDDDDGQNIDDILDENRANLNNLNDNLGQLPPNDIYNENVDFHLVYGLNESDIYLPKIIRFMDVPQFGPSLFVFCLRCLEIKDRPGLWMIIQFILCHLPTSSSVSLLITHKNELLRFPKDNLNKLCLKIIQSSQFPIATSLYLCGYMTSCYQLCGSIECDEFASLYTKIAIELCLFIESDHLLAILLEIPSDISELSILDICIEYKLVDFLYSHRLRPIFNQMWTQFKYLDPSSSFEMKPYSYLNIFNHLRSSPSSFYYSPQGLFITEVFYYIIYIIIFTIWITDLQYPYNLPISTLEIILWIFNGGYLIKEFMEAIYKKNSYFGHFSKYWDILIVLNWIIIAAIRWPWAWLIWEKYIIYHIDSGEIDESETRNQPLTIIYMICIAIQSILIWTRCMTFLQRSKKTGPLIQTIFHLIEDVWQFTILLMLFLIGCMFALYYIIGGDIFHHTMHHTEHSGTLLLYMFQTLLGQQDWDLISSSDDTQFGLQRSKVAQVIVVFFSIMGNIALLNLMIALMTSVYEQNSPLTAKQVNYAAIVNTIELVDKEAVLPSPFNLVVIIGLIIYGTIESIIYFFSCSRWSYNITRIGWTNYALNRDWIMLESVEMEKLINSNNNINNIQQINNKKSKKNRYSPVSPKNEEEEETESDDDDDDDEEDEKYNNNNNVNANNINIKSEDNINFLSNADEEMLIKYTKQREIIDRNHQFWQKKEFSSVNCTNCLSQKSAKIYCRFCRNRMITNGDISVYFFLFRHYKKLDETDKTLLMNLLTHKIICPSCFRPVKFYEDINGDSTRLWRWQVAMEIISFYVFMIVGYFPILLFLLFPAFFSWIGNRFTSWTSNYTNDSETNAKYKQQVQLNGNNVIFGGKNINFHHEHDEDMQYQHVSSTIHNEYYNFIKNEENEGNNYMILPQHLQQQQIQHIQQQQQQYNINSNIIKGSYHNALSTVNEEYQITPMKPVHTKLTQKKNINLYSNELSPVVDSPLPQNINNSNTYKEILIQLTEIKKELNVLKRYHKKQHHDKYDGNNSNQSSKRRDSKPRDSIKGGSTRSNRHKNRNETTTSQLMRGGGIDEKNEEKELSTPSLPSMPSITSSLQFQPSSYIKPKQHKQYKQHNKEHHHHSHHHHHHKQQQQQQQQRHHKQHEKPVTMKPSKHQQKHDVLTANMHRNRSSHTNPDMYDEQHLHDIIDDMSVGSIMTTTTLNHINKN